MSQKYICTVCDYIYDPAEGDLDGDIDPGTAFEDIPDDWVCPICGVGKEDFEKYEEEKDVVDGALPYQLQNAKISYSRIRHRYYNTHLLHHQLDRKQFHQLLLLLQKEQ